MMTERNMANSKALFIVMIVIGISLILTGCYLFKIIWDENSYPKGRMEQDLTYIDGGRISNYFSISPASFFNATTDITHLPIDNPSGEYGHRIFNVSGNVSGKFHSGDIVLFTTKWNASMGKESQIWTVNDYQTPQFAYALSSFPVVLGVLVIFAALPFRKGSDPRYDGMVSILTLMPSLAYVPGYFMGPVIGDACMSYLILAFGVWLFILIIPIRRSLKESIADKRPISFARGSMLMIFAVILVIIPAIAIGSICSSHYLDWSP